MDIHKGETKAFDINKSDKSSDGEEDKDLTDSSGETVRISFNIKL